MGQDRIMLDVFSTRNSIVTSVFAISAHFIIPFMNFSFVETIVGTDWAVKCLVLRRLYVLVCNVYCV